MPEIDAALARLCVKRAKVVSAAMDSGGGIRVAIVADPFGNSIGWIENPHFSLPAL